VEGPEERGGAGAYGAAMPLDDLGVDVPVRVPATRVVSLVPSLTEALAATRPEAVAAATQWCTFPADLDVMRIRGTKNPDWRAIIDLRPDLVIANKEENREIDVRRLRGAGVPVWVTRIESVPEALTSMERLFDAALGWGVPAWLRETREVWTAPPQLAGLRTAAVVWRDPWMVVGSRTFAGDVLARLGCVNAFADDVDRYPKVDVGDLDAMGLDLVLLPSEPYVFSPADGPEAFARTPTALIDGRMLTWYGPSLLSARRHLEERIRGGWTGGP
jgi:ABC-type Fe3+-hydroxamate transport system substrate-binding protein